MTALIQKKSTGDLTTAYAYADKLNRTGLTDAMGRTVHYVFDELKRLKTATYPQSPNSILRTIAYEYTDQLNLTRITEAKTTGDDETVQAYDFLNRLKTSNQRGHAVSYGYDENNNVRSVSSSGGATYSGYNARNWLTAVSPKTLGQGGDTTYSYFPDGKVQTVTRPNGTSTNYVYDGANRVKEIHHQRSGTDFLTLTYGYDADGNRQNERETQDDGGTRDAGYTYDDSDWLRIVDETKNTDNTITTYDLDKVGNRKTEGEKGDAHLLCVMSRHPPEPFS